jgi:hypothetical protein
MNTNDFSKVNNRTLLDVLERRLLRLECNAQRIGSIGATRELVEQAFNAGRSAARADMLRQLDQRVAMLLDAATANTPEPPGEGAPSEAREAYWRDGRRALWRELETMRGQFRVEADVESGVAAKARSWLEQRTRELLVPPVPLRQRVGQWLLEQSSRIAQRGAA